MSEATDLAIESLKEYALKKAIERAAIKLVALVPFLGVPIVNPVMLWFLAKYARILFEEGALLLHMGVIEVEVNREALAVKKARDDLRFYLERGNPQNIQKAKDEYKKRLSDLIRLNR